MFKRRFRKILKTEQSRMLSGKRQEKGGVSKKVGFLIDSKYRKKPRFCQGFEVKKIIKKPTFFDRREMLKIVILNRVGKTEV
jgi:hypothetical protein